MVTLSRVKKKSIKIQLLLINPLTKNIPKLLQKQTQPYTTIGLKRMNSSRSDSTI